MYESMVTIRRFEEKAYELFQRDLVMGAIHLSVGQEACAVGALSCLQPTDYLVTTHRGHGHCIMKGGDLEKMFAELLGRTTGYCKGKGGSMHIADFDIGICGANGIVGGGLPIAVGVGLASILKGDDAVTLCIFGEGASNQGSFHEALNLAALWKVPVIFICENNQYAMSTNIHRTLPIENVADRSAAYGMEGIVVDGNDVEAVHETVAKAVAKARKGGGPTLIEEKTYRVFGHFAGDPCHYRPDGEREEWEEKNDPIKRLAAKLSNGTSLQKIETRVAGKIDAAVEAAEAAPLPRIEEVTADVLADITIQDTEPAEKGSRNLTFREALNEAMGQILEDDPTTFLIGEDLGSHGGAFAVTKGLYERFGPERVRDTPISEAAIVGAANGAATRGLRPIAEVMYSDFTTVCMDQICNQAAKMRYMFGGKVAVSLVIRAPGGSGGRGNAAQHSQSLEAWFMHVPGLKLAIPSTPFDAKGLLRAAVLDDNPVLFIEHKVLYNESGPVPEQRYTIPLGKAEVKREGTDVTIVSYSRMVLRSLAAAAKAEDEGISVEIVDLRSLVPLDIETIVESVKKTGRVIIVEEDCRTCGVGAELITQIMERAFDYLDAEPLRVAGLDVPIPYSKPLEHAAVPSEQDILDAILKRV
ncbi:MAG: dehydrogenase [Planctomycetes bacterium]|nr:dehydrogenase [Planctomycetota bacterium]